MSGSSAKPVTQDIDHEALEDTLQMPALDRMLEDSEEALDAIQASSGEPEQRAMDAQLSRLVDLTESIDSRLRQIADLLHDEHPRSRNPRLRRKRSQNS